MKSSRGKPVTAGKFSLRKWSLRSGGGETRKRIPGMFDTRDEKSSCWLLSLSTRRRCSMNEASSLSASVLNDSASRRTSPSPETGMPSGRSAAIPAIERSSAVMGPMILRAITRYTTPRIADTSRINSPTLDQKARTRAPLRWALPTWTVTDPTRLSPFSTGRLDEASESRSSPTPSRSGRKGTTAPAAPRTRAASVAPLSFSTTTARISGVWTSNPAAFSTSSRL